MSMSTTARKLTFDEWLRLPETRQRYEIVDGVMCMPPGANLNHQVISQRLNRQLDGFVHSRGLGLVLTAPLDVLIQREPLRTRQPDILYLSAPKAPGDRLEDIAGIAFLELAPDLAIEILSSSNTAPYMETKLRDYQRIGVTECWLFNPVPRTASVIDLTGDAPRTAAVFGVDDTLTSDLLPGFELSLREVFR